MAVGLDVVAMAFAFVSQPGISPSLPSYPYLGGRTASLIASAVILSALLTGIALTGLVSSPAKVLLLSSFVAFLVGAALVAMTLIWAVPVQSGGRAYAAPYPQAVYPLLWGIAGFGFSILVDMIDLANRKARANPLPQPSSNA